MTEMEKREEEHIQALKHATEIFTFIRQVTNATLFLGADPWKANVTISLKVEEWMKRWVEKDPQKKESEKCES